MPPNQNAPARKGEGVDCLLAGDSDAHSTVTARIQYLARFGLPTIRATSVATLIFGEPRHG